jgi:ABC-type polysaccharide/polyol phosphate export permease
VATVSTLGALGVAGKDFVAALRHFELWTMLGWRDLQTRFRRTKLGALWVPAGLAIFSLGLGSLYAHLLQVPLAGYIPYLVAGITTWNFLSGVINEGCATFTSNAAAIKEVPLPPLVYVLRTQWRNTLVLMLSAITYIVAAISFSVPLSFRSLLVIPALMVLELNAFWLILLCATVTVQYRDAAQVVSNMVRLLFFLTPVLWLADQVSGIRALYVGMNPFYYLVDLLRAAMLGEQLAPGVWIVSLLMGATGTIFAMHWYGRRRYDVVYWA